MNPLAFIVRRIIVTLPVLLAITLITFVITHLIPADPLGMVLSERAMANPQIVAAVRARWGLDKSLPEQYLVYVSNLAHGDLGTSLSTQREVSDDLVQFFPATLELSLAAMFIALAFGLPLGVIAALQRDRWPDHLARVLTLIGVAVPVFWLGLIALNVFYYNLNWVPGPGRLDSRLMPPPTVTGLFLIDSLVAGRGDLFVDAVQHLVLPALILGAYAMGSISRLTRSSLLETIAQDYIRTARAKGLTEHVVTLRHALRNALIPTVTAIGLAFGNLMSGAVMTETIFAWPGIGRYAVSAAERLDFPAIMGVTLIVALIYLIINLTVDVSYMFLDPRVRVS